MTLYLSRLVLNPRCRAVRHDLADCHALHDRVMCGFPQTERADARAAFGVLYRLEPTAGRPPTLLVQSAVAPNWASLPTDYLAACFDGMDNPACKRVDDWYAAIAAGDELAFRLRANPTRRLPARHAGANRLAGKRVALLKEEEQVAWLRRKAAEGGFAVLAVRGERNDLRSAKTGAEIDAPAVQTMPRAEQIGYRPRPDGAGRVQMTFGAVLFEGRLRVVEPERLRAALATGLGSGKAYGFGLLSVAPAGPS